jgi:hypothetical protein
MINGKFSVEFITFPKVLIDLINSTKHPYY